MLAAIALANKMARSIWAMLAKGKIIEFLRLWRYDRLSDCAARGTSDV